MCEGDVSGMPTALLDKASERQPHAAVGGAWALKPESLIVYDFRV